ncbi:MAG: hypothetical protein K9I85_07185 [Saprospiraceae bacterium]|nr:hypothetical protein [Saprospiraceae bacterium]
MRPVLASTLALFFILPTLAYLTSTSWQRDHLRKEAKQLMLRGIPEKSLVRIAIPTDGTISLDFEWLKKDEFRYRGMMYDVISHVQVADSLIFMAWPDQHETAFESDVKDLLARLLGADPVHTHMQQNWSRFLQQLYPPSISPTMPHIARMSWNHPPDRSPAWTTQFSIHPPAPPPQLIG